MKDATSQLRSATRRAKSDVANKMVSMFLHELSRKICREWGLRVDGEEYGKLVRLRLGNCCPYCLRTLQDTTSVIEHLDGMNRYRTGLHIPGNVLVSCRKCNSEKRRDDGRKTLVLAECGWVFDSYRMMAVVAPCPVLPVATGLRFGKTRRNESCSSPQISRRLSLFEWNFRSLKR